MILLTGSAGRIGRSLRKHLRDEIRFRCFDVATIPRPGSDEIIIGDVRNLSQLIEAAQGMEAIIHLAANPHPRASWESVRDLNVIGTYNVFEAARQCNVSLIIFASSNHATGFYEREKTFVTADLPPRPDSLYGVSKVLGEVLGRYYADEFGMRVICFRIGSFLADDNPLGKGDRILGTWCSHRDFAQLVRLALTNTVVKYGVFYAVSGNERRPWDIEDAVRALGYRPADNAERLRQGNRN